MNIEELPVPDIQEDNIEETKLKLANEIIEKINPLFSEVLSEKTIELSNKQQELEDKKTKITEIKNKLEELIKTYNLLKKKRRLLNKVETLINSGLVYDGNLRSDTIILLKILNNLPESKLDEQYSYTSRIIQKRFNRL